MIQELRNVAALYEKQSEELSMSMAVYMLGFSSYMGFKDQMEKW